MDPSERIVRVYADAEAALSAVVTDEVRKTVDAGEETADTLGARLAAVRRIRQAAQRAVAVLDGLVPPLAREALDAAAADGAGEATAALRLLLGADPAAATAPLDRNRLDRLAAATVDTITGAHQSILRTTPDVYRTVVTRAAAGLLVGAHTRRQAAQRAMWEFARQGVTGFTDAAGRRWELASYVDMAIRTAAQRARTDGLVDFLAANGHDLVIGTDSPAECGWCRPLENAVMSIGGPPGRRTVEVPHARDPGRTVSVDVVDSIAGARARGWQHPNCRHTVIIYLPGITEPPVGPGRGPDPAGEAARDRQRGIERELRHWKRRADLALDTPARRRAEGYAAAWRDRLAGHLADHPDLPRLPLRRRVGQGFAPTEAQLADPTGPFPDLPPDPPRPPADLTDDELDEAMAEALAVEDLDRFGVLGDESDRRETARDRRAARNARDRERRELRRAADLERQGEMLDRLLDSGVDEEEAVERAYGTPVEQQRRQRVFTDLRRGGYRGSFRAMTRDAFRDQLEHEHIAAADAAGFLLSREATRRHIDPEKLFTGSEVFARRWASDELLEWWDGHGRITYDSFVAELLGGTATRARGGDFLQ